MAPVLGEELYNRLSHPPVMSRVDAPIGVPAMRLASRIAARLAGPYGAASGDRSESLATNIVSRLGPPSPVGPTFDAAPGPAPLPLILRRAAPRASGAPEQVEEQPLSAPQWPMFNRRPVAAEVGLPRAIANESEAPRWRALPDESQADYVASNLPDLGLPSLAETLGLVPPSFSFASTLPPSPVAPEAQLEPAPPVEMIEPLVVAEQPAPPVRSQPLPVVVPVAMPPAPYVQPVAVAAPVPATPPVAVIQPVPAPVGPLAVLRQALTRAVPDALGRLIGRNTQPFSLPEEPAAPPIIATTAAPLATVAEASAPIEPVAPAPIATQPVAPIDTAPIYATSSSREQIEPFAPAADEPNLPLFQRIARALRLPVAPAVEPPRPALTLRRPATPAAQNVPPVLEPPAEEVRRAAPAPAPGRPITPARVVQPTVASEGVPPRVVQPSASVGEAPTSVIHPALGVGEAPARFIQPNVEVAPTFDAHSLETQLPAVLAADNAPQPQVNTYAADPALSFEQAPIAQSAQPVNEPTTTPTNIQVDAPRTGPPRVQPPDLTGPVAAPNYAATQAGDTLLSIPGAPTAENYAPSVAEPAFTASVAAPTETASDSAGVEEAANITAPVPYEAGEVAQPSRFAGVPLFEAVARFFRPAAENEERAPLERPLRRRGGRNAEAVAPEEIISASGPPPSPVRPIQGVPATTVATPPLRPVEQPGAAGTVVSTTGGDINAAPSGQPIAAPAIPTSAAPPATTAMDAPVNPAVAGSSVVTSSAPTVSATPLTTPEAQRIVLPPTAVGASPVPAGVAATTLGASSPTVSPGNATGETVAASSVARESVAASSADIALADEPLTSTVEARPSRFAGLPLYQAITRFFSRTADPTPAAVRPPLVWRTGPARPAIGQESAPPVEEAPVTITASRASASSVPFRAAEIAAPTPDVASIVELAADQPTLIEAQLAAEGITLPASNSVPAMPSSVAASAEAPVISPSLVSGGEPVTDQATASPIAPTEYGSVAATPVEAALYIGSADGELGADTAQFGAGEERQPSVLDFVRRMAAPLVRLRSLPFVDLGEAAAQQGVPVPGTDRPTNLPLHSLASFLARSNEARVAGTADGPSSFDFGGAGGRAGAQNTSPAGAASYSAPPTLSAAGSGTPLIARAGANSGLGFAGTFAAGSGLGGAGLAGFGSPVADGATGSASGVSVQRQVAGTPPTTAPVGPLWRTLTYLRQQGRVTPAEYQEYVAAGSSGAPLMFRPERWAALWAAEGATPFAAQGDDADAGLPFFANAPIYGDEPLPLAPLGHNPAAAPEALAADSFAGFDFGFDSGFAAPTQNFAATPARGAAAPVQRKAVGAATVAPGGDAAGEWAGVINRAVADSADGSALDLALAPAERGALPMGTMSAPEPATPGAAGPDLDQIADEVYGMIRRRLVVERERSWT